MIIENGVLAIELSVLYFNSFLAPGSRMNFGKYVNTLYCETFVMFQQIQLCRPPHPTQQHILQHKN